jgi:hypothetical protein
VLFDLQSPGRKTAVRIIFGFLAFIFAAGFIFLGIGTEGGLNPFDAVGGSTDDAFEQQVEDAEEEVDQNPDDPEALADLVQLRYSSGEAQLDVDEETGIPSLTEESRSEFEETVARWQDYLDLEPKKVDAAAAGAARQAYLYLEDPEGMIDTQRALAESDPSGTNLGVLADLLYRDLQIEKADEVRKDALAAANGELKKTLAQQLNAIRKQAVKFEEQQKKAPDTATGDGSELADPFGELSPTDPAGGLGTGTGVAP